MRWYAEERRRTRTFDSPPVDHDFESFRIIFCALRDAERASDISSFSSPLFFSPPSLFHLSPLHTQITVLPVTAFVFSLFFPRTSSPWSNVERNAKTTRLNIGAANSGSVPRCTHARTFLSSWKHRYRCKARFDSVVPARPIAITTIRVKFESKRH